MIANQRYIKVCPDCGVFAIDPNNHNSLNIQIIENPDHLDIDQCYDKFVNEVKWKCKSCGCITTMNNMPRRGEYLNIKRTKLIDKMLK